MRPIIILTTFLWGSLALGQQQSISEQPTSSENEKSMEDSVSNPKQPSILEAAAGGAAYDGRRKHQNDEGLSKDRALESKERIIESDAAIESSNAYSTAGKGAGGKEGRPEVAASPNSETGQMHDSTNVDGEDD